VTGSERQLRVETPGEGPFVFRLGIDPAEFELSLCRIEDARFRFESFPIVPRIAEALEREIHACSVSHTNLIDGGTISEEAADAILRLPEGTSLPEPQRRLRNIGHACVRARQAVEIPGWRMTTAYIRELHAIVSSGIPDERNRPGEFRSAADPGPAIVGEEKHGGRYRPPAGGAGLERLVESLLEWNESIGEAGIPALLRAPLVHYHFALIHPFGICNGFVGRLLEASILYAAGYGLPSFCLWRYYAEQVDRYFSLFNACRLASGNGEPTPNAPFVSFHLEAMLAGQFRRIDRVNGIVSTLLFEGEVRRMRDAGDINLRQYAILSHLMESGEDVALDRLRRMPWYEGLYRRMADKTRQRDLRQMKDSRLVQVEEGGLLRLAFRRPRV
jgi:hypothetical protein